jgi:hypothetical protein
MKIIKAITILTALTTTLHASTTWKSKMNIDDMTGEITGAHMRVNSETPVSIYYGKARPTFWIYCNKEGISAHYTISKGFFERDMESSRIILDRGKVETIRGEVPRRNSGFFYWDNISMEKIEAFKKSTVLKVELSPWRAWEQTTTFDMTGFNEAYNNIKGMCPDV